jgi:hypothetical protein
MDMSVYAMHSPFSDPGRHAWLLARVPADPLGLHHAVTRTVQHYDEADPAPLTSEQLADINLRWMSAILDTATARAPGPLDAPRKPEHLVGGSCRDHALLAVAILRQHGIPARTRVGFADYFQPGFRHIHVVAEQWRTSTRKSVSEETDALDAAAYGDGRDEDVPGRWVRLDPERSPDSGPFDAYDMPTGEGSPFETAAEAWLALRAGRIDGTGYGADPKLPGLCGAAQIQSHVLADLAHRMRSELLLWDVWEARTLPWHEPDEDTVLLTDRIATLTIRGDTGVPGAERELAALWHDNPRARPGRTVHVWSPSGQLAGTTDLTTRTTT